MVNKQKEINKFNHNLRRWRRRKICNADRFNEDRDGTDADEGNSIVKDEAGRIIWGYSPDAVNCGSVRFFVVCRGESSLSGG